MTKFINAIWALLLNFLGVNIFKTCFVDAMENDSGNYILSGPPITSFIFTLGVFTIISNLNFYPTTFKKPMPLLLGIYEFLVTAFILEFSVACIWAPIDVHIYTTLTKALIKAFVGFGCNSAPTWLLNNKFPMALLCFAVAIGFFLVTLYVTRSVDFTIYRDFGTSLFAQHIKETFIHKLAKELPKFDDCDCDSNCKGHKKYRRKRRKY